MSQELGQVGQWSATLFWGGQDRGSCVQFTGLMHQGEHCFVQVPLTELVDFQELVSRVLDSQRRAEQVSQ